MEEGGGTSPPIYLTKPSNLFLNSIPLQIQSKASDHTLGSIILVRTEKKLNFNVSETIKM